MYSPVLATKSYTDYYTFFERISGTDNGHIWTIIILTCCFCNYKWTGMDCYGRILAEDHRSRTCPGPLAAPTGFEVQPPHRRRRSSAPRLLHGGGAHYSYFLEFLHPPDQFFPPNTRSVLSRKHYNSYKTHILQ